VKYRELDAIGVETIPVFLDQVTDLLCCCWGNGTANFEVLTEFITVKDGAPGTDVLAGESADSWEWLGDGVTKFLEYEDGIIVFSGIINGKEPIFWFRAPYFSWDGNDASKWVGNADRE
jgi:hypothetical protein